MFDLGLPTDDPRPVTADGLPRLPPQTVKAGKKVFKKDLSKEDAESKGKPPARGRLSAAPQQSRSNERDPLIGTLLGLRNAFQFPLRTEALIMIAVHAVLYGLFVGDPHQLGVMIAAAMIHIKVFVYFALFSSAILSYFGYFLFGVLRATSQDDQDLPVAASFDWEEIFIDGFLWAGGLFVGSLPLMLYLIGSVNRGEAPNLLVLPILIGFFFFYAPMSVLSTALHTTVRGANPVMVLVAIFRIPFQYLMTVFFTGGLLVATVLASLLVPSITFITGPILWFFLFYTMTAMMAALGNLYYRNRRTLGWFRESPPRQ